MISSLFLYFIFLWEWSSLTDKILISTLLCIPIGGELLPRIGGAGFVAFFSSFLVVSLMAFIIARWACLDYKWKWTAKI